MRCNTSLSIIMVIFTLFYCLAVSTVSVFGTSANQDLSLTEKELRALTELKNSVMPKLENEKDYTRTDIYLIRWLRAKNLNVKAAEDMLMEVINLNLKHSDFRLDFTNKYSHPTPEPNVPEEV